MPRIHLSILCAPCCSNFLENEEENYKGQAISLIFLGTTFILVGTTAGQK